MFRRVVPSPTPVRIQQADTIRLLVESGQLVVCVGGGGVPVRIDETGREVGMQAVVDKDLASENWGTPHQRDILTASPEAIAELEFAEGSMQPKVDAAIRVAKAGGRALIGPLEKLSDLLARRVGTEVRPNVPEGIVHVGA